MYTHIAVKWIEKCLKIFYLQSVRIKIFQSLLSLLYEEKTNKTKKVCEKIYIPRRQTFLKVNYKQSVLAIARHHHNKENNS